MKRKVFSILFAAVMAVSLAACGGDGGSGNADTADGGAQPGQEAGNASGDSAGGEEQVLIVSMGIRPASTRTPLRTITRARWRTISTAACLR